MCGLELWRLDVCLCGAAGMGNKNSHGLVLLARQHQVAGVLRTSWDSAGMTYTMDVLGLGIITLTTSHQFVGYQQAQQQAEGLRIVQVGQPTPGSE